ncbi:MAG: hypothetical protein K2X47_03065 [Bdellovibrionales bacterium]|nr:hypothetical protein [Bdellovibrionales bacterium]
MSALKTPESPELPSESEEKIQEAKVLPFTQPSRIRKSESSKAFPSLEHSDGKSHTPSWSNFILRTLALCLFLIIAFFVCLGVFHYSNSPGNSEIFAEFARKVVEKVLLAAETIITMVIGAAIASTSRILKILGLSQEP